MPLFDAVNTVLLLIFMTMVAEAHMYLLPSKLIGMYLEVSSFFTSYPEVGHNSSRSGKVVQMFLCPAPGRSRSDPIVDINKLVSICLSPSSFIRHILCELHQLLQ